MNTKQLLLGLATLACATPLMALQQQPQVASCTTSGPCINQIVIHNPLLETTAGHGSIALSVNTVDFTNNGKKVSYALSFNQLVDANGSVGIRDLLSSGFAPLSAIIGKEVSQLDVSTRHMDPQSSEYVPVEATPLSSCQIDTSKLKNIPYNVDITLSTLKAESNAPLVAKYSCAIYPAQAQG